MDKFLRSSFVAVCGVMFAGCGPLHVNKTVGLSGLPPVAASKVTVVENWADVNRPYQVVGKGTLYRNAGGVPKGGALKQLRQMAGEMGADGVVGLHGTTSFRSALLVKWLQPGETKQPVTRPFAIGLLPLRMDLSGKEDQEKLTGWVLGASIFELEQKGHYLLPKTVSGYSAGLDEALKLSPNNLQAVGGDEAHLLLEVGVANRSELNLGVYNEARGGFYVKLLNKQTREIVYEGNAVGIGTGSISILQPGLAALENAFEPDLKRATAVRNGLHKAFENLKPISP